MTRFSTTNWLKALTYIGIYGGLLMPLAFFPVVIFPFVFSKLLFFQILVGITFPAYLVLAWRDPSVRPRASMLYLSILAYFLAIGASTIFSVDPSRSWWGNQERMNGLFTLLHFFAWLSMTVGTLKTWPQWRRLLDYQVLLSVVMAIVAILQKPIPLLLRFPAGDRVGGLLDNPIYMGAYQIFNFFFIALLTLKAPTWKRRAWYAVALAFDATAFILAQSRGALLGLAVGIIVFVAAYAITTPSKRARKFALGGLLLCFASYGVLYAAKNTAFIQNSPLARFTSFSTPRTRLIAWDIAWKGFLDRPLTGWGIDTFHVLFNAKYNPESLRYSYYETWFDRSHNTILDVLSMTGIFGLVTFIAIFASLYVMVIRAYRKKWLDSPTMSVLVALPLAYFVQNLFVFDHPAAFSMSYLLYALVIAATAPAFFQTQDADSPPSAPVAVGSKFFVAFLALEALALALIWRSSWLPMQASIISINSNSAFGRGDYLGAFEYAKQAEKIPTPYLEEQTFLQSRNLISLAGDQTKLSGLSYWREWYDLATRISDQHLASHGNNTHPRFIYARMAHSFAPFVPEAAVTAEREYKEAIKLSPKRQQLYFNYSRLLIEQRRNAEAADLLKQVISFEEEIGEGYWLLGLHQYYDTDQKIEGANNLVKSQKVRFPYVLQDPREAVALAQAYDVINDASGLLSLMTALKTLPRGDLGLYIQIATAMEHQGLIVQRDMIVGAVRALDETWAKRLEPLVEGSATSISSSLTIADKAMSSPKTATTTGSSSGSGPRKKK